MTELITQSSLGTYGALTAESILAYANVHLSKDDLEMQLNAHDSFYSELVKIPTEVVRNSLLNTQCRDLQSYSQERLIEYILSGVENKMTSEADIKLKEKIEAERLSLIQLGSELTELETAHYQFMLSVYVLQEHQSAQWSEAMEQHAETLWKEIEQCKADMPLEYQQHLLHYLNTQSAALTFTEKELKSQKVKYEPCAVEKAVLKLFIDVGTRICPNVVDTAKNIEINVQQLQDELREQRGVLVSTVQTVKAALLEKNTQFSEKREIINTLLLEVDENVNAFKASDDTINNNLNMNTLEDLGFVKSK